MRRLIVYPITHLGLVKTKERTHESSVGEIDGREYWVFMLIYIWERHRRQAEEGAGVQLSRPRSYRSVPRKHTQSQSLVVGNRAGWQHAV